MIPDLDAYLIVKKPRSAEAVRLTLDIAADVVTRHGLLSASHPGGMHGLSRTRVEEFVACA